MPHPCNSQHGHYMERPRWRCCLQELPIARTDVHSTVRSNKFLLLGPHRAVPHEDIRGATATARKGRTYDRRVAVNEDGLSELVDRRAVSCDEFLLLRPVRAIANVDVGRSTETPSLVMARRADDERLPANRDSLTTTVPCGSVRGRSL